MLTTTMMLFVDFLGRAVLFLVLFEQKKVVFLRLILCLGNVGELFEKRVLVLIIIELLLLPQVLLQLKIVLFEYFEALSGVVVLVLCENRRISDWLVNGKQVACGLI